MYKGHLNDKCVGEDI